ncbi:hypothetical protein DL771_009684 [Monosporascus sp. 5C6A]|nr:hypothetical protein DL771_009684 [Monosporascus sp. 5C6A]
MSEIENRSGLPDISDGCASFRSPSLFSGSAFTFRFPPPSAPERASGKDREDESLCEDCAKLDLGQSLASAFALYEGARRGTVSRPLWAYRRDSGPAYLKDFHHVASLGDRLSRETNSCKLCAFPASTTAEPTIRGTTHKLLAFCSSESYLYVALSYAWGTSKEKWPQTVLDATNEDEKRSLFPKMDLIYDGAEFTITGAAGDARTGSPGVTRKQRKPQPRPDPDPGLELVGVPLKEYEREAPDERGRLDPHRHGPRSGLALDMGELMKDEELMEKYDIPSEHLRLSEDFADDFGHTIEKFLEIQKEFALRMGIPLREMPCKPLPQAWPGKAPLPKRRLVFTEEKVYWECCGMAVNETLGLHPSIIQAEPRASTPDYMLSGIFEAICIVSPELQYGFRPRKHEEGASIPVRAGLFGDGKPGLQHTFALSTSGWRHSAKRGSRRCGDGTATFSKSASSVNKIWSAEMMLHEAGGAEATLLTGRAPVSSTADPNKRWLLTIRKPPRAAAHVPHALGERVGVVPADEEEGEDPALGAHDRGCAYGRPQDRGLGDGARLREQGPLYMERRRSLLNPAENG